MSDSSDESKDLETKNGEEGDEDVQTPIETHIDELENDIHNIQDAIEGLNKDVNNTKREITGLEENFQDALEDVRGRVIQLKKELDTKADSEQVDTQISDIQSSINSLEEDIVDISQSFDRVDQDIKSLSEQLDTIDPQLEELDTKTLQLAKFALDLEDKVDYIEQSQMRNEDLLSQRDEVMEIAHKKGVESGICSGCGSNIELGLIRYPECPHCQSTIRDIRSRYIRDDKIIVEESEESEEPEDKPQDL